MKDEKLYLINILGPTAVGKTALAIALAEALQTEIISCDARQFYKEMKIGTAVPSNMELERVPHHFIQHISIEDTYSAGHFEQDALNCLEQLFKTRKYVVMVGGSGLFARAVIQGLDDVPSLNLETKKRLVDFYQTEGLLGLKREVHKIDPIYFEKVDKNNPHRLMRILGVFWQTGKPITTFYKRKNKPRFFQSINIGLTLPRDQLYDQINHRVDLMIEQGLEHEAQGLYPKKDHIALKTVGYKEFFDFFDAKQSFKQTEQAIKKNTRNYAKRQLTWFRREKDINWFSVDKKKIIQYICRFSG